MKRAILTMLVLAISACTTEKTGVTAVETKQSAVTDNQITAERIAGGIRLTNGSGKEIMYVAKNEAWLGLLGGCNHGTQSCPKLGAGKSVEIESADIHGYAPAAATLEVWYWVVGSDDEIGKTLRLPLN